MKITEDGYEVELEHHSLDYQHADEFWQQITKYHELGYKMKKNVPLSYLTFAPIVRVMLTKAPPEVIQEGEDRVAAAKVAQQAEINYIVDSEELDGYSKKEELLNFAHEHNIDVPKGKQNPSAIKKYLKETFKL